MKNIHILPTDKSSRLWINNLLQGKLELSEEALPYNTAQNIYITSDEEIKEGDYFIAYSVTIDKKPYISCASEYKERKKEKGKIILTTDQDLIKDGVQAIEDDFLEWFVKNPSCEKVEVNKEQYHQFVGMKKIPLIPNYKIIIPKEEPKQDLLHKYTCLRPQVNFFSGMCSYCNCNRQIVKNLTTEDLKQKQETLEEAAERTEFERYGQILTNYTKQRPAYNLGFNNGAKWQAKRMYSEEEIIDLLLARDIELNSLQGIDAAKRWFEQIKKK